MNISIVIPVYNASLTLKECLDAIFNSNFKNLEVIVVSDNSSDNSVALDLDVFLNNADLDGTVSNTATTYGDSNGRASHTEVHNSNEISGGSANYTGVGAFAQNAGNGSVTQANVSVMSNLSTGGGGGTQ